MIPDAPQPDPLARLAALDAEAEAIASKRVSIAYEAKEEIPDTIKRLGSLCKAAGVFVPRRDLIEAGVIESRGDETVKRPRKPKGEPKAEATA